MSSISNTGSYDPRYVHGLTTPSLAMVGRSKGGHSAKGGH